MSFPFDWQGIRSSTSSHGFLEYRPRVFSYSQVQPSPAQFQFHSDTWQRQSNTSVGHDSVVMRNLLPQRSKRGNDPVFGNARSSTGPPPRYRDQTNSSVARRAMRVAQVTTRGHLDGLPFDRLAMEIVGHAPGLVGFYSLPKDSELSKLVTHALNNPATEHQFFHNLSEAIKAVSNGLIRFDPQDRMRLDSRSFVFLVRARLSPPWNPIRTAVSSAAAAAAATNPSHPHLLHHHNNETEEEQQEKKKEGGGGRGEEEEEESDALADQLSPLSLDEEDVKAVAAAGEWLEVNHVIKANGAIMGFAWQIEDGELGFPAALLAGTRKNNNIVKGDVSSSSVASSSVKGGGGGEERHEAKSPSEGGYVNVSSSTPHDDGDVVVVRGDSSS